MVLGDEADTRQHKRRPFPRRRAEHAHGACGGSREADGKVQERRLPGPVRTDERGDGTGRDFERAVPQSSLLAIAFAEVPRFQRKLAHAASSKKTALTVAVTSAVMLSSSNPALRARSIHRSKADCKAE